MYQVSALRPGEESDVGVRRADFLLAPFFKDSGISSGVALNEIKKNWSELFQPPLSLHMSPCVLHDGELLIHVDSPAWIQELNFFREEIGKKLAPYGIRSIRFRLGRVVVHERHNNRSRPGSTKHLNREERSFVEDAVNPIEDERIRQTLANTIEKAIIAGKTKIPS